MLRFSTRLPLVATSPAAVVLMSVATGAILIAKERIFVDQWSPTRSELFIADADGRNARKLVAGLELDYNASFSADGAWVVFTSERHGSADIFRVRTTAWASSGSLTIQRSTIRPPSRRTAARWRSCRRGIRERPTSI